MAHTRTWNTAYEAIPADGDDARGGGNRIRDLKTDISERMRQDHSWDPASADDTNDGFHEMVTFLEQASAPATKTNALRLYGLDVGGVTELYWKDSAGSAKQITNAGDFKIKSDVNSWTAGQAITPSTLTDGATVTPNMSTSNNFYWVIGGNRTLANPTNAKAGDVITVVIAQDGTGGRTITFGSKYKFPNGMPKTLSTGASDRDLLTGIYNATLDIWLCSLAKDYV